MGYSPIMHFHGYYWRGLRARRQKEIDDSHPDGPRFAVSDIPPLKICHWLRKSPPMHRGTWETAAAGVAWMVRCHDGIADLVVEPSPWNTTEDLRGATTAALGAGRDACWNYRLHGGEQVFTAVVCCPNLWEDLACPLKKHPPGR
ncbi:hypothetical protein GCM10009799_37670 [Nocardiopsis rhodophaea]|uniref:Uncharacterized protein n=2 Tax=Nocardiopsis rhodophaea TaxID=280238 RepID=A0ABN2TEJ7_9ACTN